MQKRANKWITAIKNAHASYWRKSPKKLKRFAYKVKKAVDLGFLDFTTLERRRHFCHEEVRLNRRLAPNVYLGAFPVAEAHLVNLMEDREGSLEPRGDTVDIPIGPDELKSVLVRPGS